MTGKIFRSILAVAASVLLASFVIITGILYEYFGGVQTSELEDELELAEISVENYGADYLKKIKSDRFRFTLISEDGSVIYDTETGTDGMENHAEREEVKQALTAGEGKSTRYSSTLTRKTVYYAKKISDGSILRISASYAAVGMLLAGMLQPMLVVFIAVFALSAFFAMRLSRRITEPLNNLDLDHPCDNDTYEELSPLLCRIDRQHKEISKKLEELRRKTDEFDQIIENMNEGLVLLDKNGTVLGINSSAEKIFETDRLAVGQNFLGIDRAHNLTLAIKAALHDGSREIGIERGGREYRVNISAINSSDGIVGAVILAYDITDQKFAERNRREFTANVSHELKTPLQGIIGSAELIEAGMVKSEDLPRFVERIRKEAYRLVALTEDIMRLSGLDEGNVPESEDVDLLSAAHDVVSELRPRADAKNIGITVTGNGATMHGVRSLLREVIFNLVDNAIKYNIDGGAVHIDVSSDEKGNAITVSDTGIGIAPEHLSRVFERFYRVDKSRSKASGGTGLGLSIVKHAVRYMNGKIDIESTPGEGTTIKIIFPTET